MFPTGFLVMSESVERFEINGMLDLPKNHVLPEIAAYMNQVINGLSSWRLSIIEHVHMQCPSKNVRHNYWLLLQANMEVISKNISGRLAVAV